MHQNKAIEATGRQSANLEKPKMAGLFKDLAELKAELSSLKQTVYQKMPNTDAKCLHRKPPIEGS